MGMATPTDDQQGNAENFKFGIQSIRIGDGSMVDIGGPGSVTVVVGANNVGKSTLLVQIRDILMSDSLTRDASPRVVTEVSAPWTGTTDDLEAWIRANSHIQPSGGVLEHAVRPGLPPVDIKSILASRRTPTPGPLINWFVKHQTAGSGMDGAQAGRPQAGDAPAHPLQVLYLSVTPPIATRRPVVLG